MKLVALIIKLDEVT